MDLLGTGRVSRRRSRMGLLMVAGAALALAMPPVAMAASDDTAALKAQLNALTQQLKALAAQKAVATRNARGVSGKKKRAKVTAAAPVAAAAATPTASK